jgi:hypothetical protein
MTIWGAVKKTVSSKMTVYKRGMIAGADGERGSLTSSKQFQQMRPLGAMETVAVLFLPEIQSTGNSDFSVSKTLYYSGLNIHYLHAKLQLWIGGMSSPYPRDHIFCRKYGTLYRPSAPSCLLGFGLLVGPVGLGIIHDSCLF